MPKSAAHLYIHYPADWTGCQWRQSLDIESGTLTISISHFEGVELLIQAVIHPECNRFSVNWEIKNYSPDKLYGGYFFGLPELPQVYATMFRPDAVDAGKFADQEMLEHGNNYFCFSKTYPTLPPAEVCNGQLVQKLPEGKTLYAALAGDGNFECSKGNFLRILPAMDALKGCFFAGISTDDADTAAGLAAYGNWEKDYRDTKLAAE
jgi:hypothetical protein